MDLGCFLTPYFPDTAEPAENADELLRRATRCAEAGYDYAEVGDHHVTKEGQFFQNFPTAGRLTGLFDHVAVLALLPLYEPLFVAEYLGTLGAFTDRLDLWCAVGGNESAFDAVGVPMDSRAGRFQESLTLLERLFTEDSVTFDGDYFSVEDVAVNPRANPRLCIGGLAKPAIERAGRLGDAWIGHPSEGLEALERKMAWHEDAGGDRVIARRDALVLEDGDEARGRAQALLEDGFRSWPTDAEWPIVGDVADATAELARLRDLGVDEVVVGAMDHDHAVETFRMVARSRNRL